MSSQQSAMFQEALEMVELLPEEQQEDLINIIKRRRIERRREALAESTGEAWAEHVRGEVTRGKVDGLMKDLPE